MQETACRQRAGSPLSGNPPDVRFLPSQEDGAMSTIQAADIVFTVRKDSECGQPGSFVPEHCIQLVPAPGAMPVLPELKPFAMPTRIPSTDIARFPSDRRTKR